MKKFFFVNNIKEKILILFIILFSLLVNQYYGNRGIFPVDSFAHFDTGFRILLGEYPFKDYWVVSGPLLDYIQAFFFYFFGINWQSYVFHASLLNVILTLSLFLVLKEFGLNIYYSFLYCILFSILAYPSSGTPFVDHHSAFFSLLGIFSLILGIRLEKKIYWVLIPIFLGFAFLSKQVPSFYVILSTLLILIFFSIIQKKYYWIKYSFLSLVAFILVLMIFGKIQGISLSSFLEQYIFYPPSIGEQRFRNINFTLTNVLDHFKFIYLVFLPLIYFNLKKIFYYKNYIKEKDFFYFLILILFTFSLIFHQMFTKNQTFIFFLIPILTAFSHICLIIHKSNLNKLIRIILILICVFATFKYHLRFNENRKFHEFTSTNFDLFAKGMNIDKKFTGLKWITPDFKNNPKEEIRLINEVKSHLKNDKRNKMLITNYSFYSVLLKEKLFSPSRWYIADGTDYPMKNNKYFESYKNLLINSIRKNNIEVIYTFFLLKYPLERSILYTYLDKNCFNEKKITETLVSYELKNCY